jgi:hypothetical protein
MRRAWPVPIIEEAADAMRNTSVSELPYMPYVFPGWQTRWIASCSPVTAHYEELNIFGAFTGRVHVAQRGEPLPRTPLGFTWRPINQVNLAD